ncbi:unnamed protein product [Candida verbasci]|uniref:Karyogamy protein KAR4 n=1 Tax=Candida verbasci TaxID=1227364 RepID=A0A9W4TP44_9ASCO|nr:unnamed protein product [Candida verbasci]
MSYTYNKFGSRSTTTKINPPTTSTTEIPDVKLDYNNNYVHTNVNPISYIKNIQNPVDGYPKLIKLHQLKKQQINVHATQAYGKRVETDQIIPVLNSWIKLGLKFDVIMIGALVDNQFILPILNSLPINKLCSKPGFLFIWASTEKIKELTKLLNENELNKKFRRSEEIVFLPIDKNSKYYPNQEDNVGLFENQQWHCWMCITGTVRRSTDGDLIHCNIDTDLQIQNNLENNAVPDLIYKICENFSNSNRRLHIIPSKLDENHYIKLRKGWVIMSPDILLDNFDVIKYNDELYQKSMIKRQDNKDQFLIQVTNEIEQLRPKTPK